MTEPASPVPGHRHTVTPRLVFQDARAAIEFYRDVFGAEPRGEPFAGPGGMVVHAEIRIGDSVVYLTDQGDNGGEAIAPASAGGRVTAIMVVTVPDVDQLWARAVAAGCEVIHPLADQFYGEREGPAARPVRAPVDARQPHRGCGPGRTGPQDAGLGAGIGRTNSLSNIHLNTGPRGDSIAATMTSADAERGGG